MNSAAEGEGRDGHGRRHRPDDRRGPAWERWLAVALRSAHLVGVVALGGLLLGAPNGHGAWVAAGVVLTGAVLMALDVHAGRLVLRELAGAFVAFKLVLVAWIAWQPAHGAVLFWLLVLGSSLVSHAPKSFRHIRVWP